MYDRKNPFFENVVRVEDNKIKVEDITSIIYEDMKKDTAVGVVNGKFDNTDEINEKLKAKSIPQFFDHIKSEVKKYYESN